MISDDVWKAMEQVADAGWQRAWCDAHNYGEMPHQFTEVTDRVIAAMSDILAALRKANFVDARAQMFQAGKARV